MTTHEERIARLEEIVRRHTPRAPSTCVRCGEFNEEPGHVCDEPSTVALERAWAMGRGKERNLSEPTIMAVARAIDAAVAEERKRLPTWDAYHRMDEERDALRAELEEARERYRLRGEALKLARENDDRHVQQRDEARAELEKAAFLNDALGAGKTTVQHHYAELYDKYEALKHASAETQESIQALDKLARENLESAQDAHADWGEAARQRDEAQDRLDRLVAAVEAWRESSRNPEAWGTLNDALKEARA